MSLSKQEEQHVLKDFGRTTLTALLAVALLQCGAPATAGQSSPHVTQTAGFCPIDFVFDGVSRFTNDHSGHLVWTGSATGDGSQTTLVVTGNGRLAGHWEFNLKTSGDSDWFVGTVVQKPDGTILKTINVSQVIRHSDGTKTVIFDAQHEGFPAGTKFIDFVFADSGNGGAFTDTISNITVDGIIAYPNLSQSAPIYYCLAR